MIIDTSNALAAPGSSRGYACLSVACRSIASPGVPCAPRGVRAAGGFLAGPVPGPSVPPSVDDGVCAPAPPREAGETPRPRFSHLGSFLAPHAANGKKKGSGSRGPVVVTGSPSPLWPLPGFVARAEAESCAGSRPGDACPGGGPRDAAVSSAAARSSPRAVAAPRRAPAARVWGWVRVLPLPPSPPSPGRRPPVLPPARAPVRPPASSPRPRPPGDKARRRGRRGVSAVVSRVCWRVRVLSPASPVGKALSLRGALARPFRDATSDQTWRPAEFKHISQRRKRN